MDYKESKLAKNKIFGVVCLIICIFTILAVTHKIAAYFFEYDEKWSPIDYGRFNALAYFTIQSNLLVAIYLFFVGLASFGIDKVKKIAYSPLFGSLVTTYIVVTGLVFCGGIPFGFTPPFTFDTPYHSMQSFIQIYNHMIIPVFMFVIWFFPFTNQKSKPKSCFYAFIYPFIYSIFCIIRGAVGKNHYYPYPFYKVEFFWNIFFKDKEINMVGAYFLLIFILCLGMFLFIGLARLMMLIHDKMIDKQFKEVEIVEA